MDYVREELARQRLALALLMMGGQAEPSAQEDGTARQADLLGTEADPRWERTGSGADGAARWDLSEAGRTVSAELLYDLEAASVRSVERTGGAESGTGRTGMASTGEPAERSAGREPAMAEDGAVRERTVTEILWTDAGGTSVPGELSRTFQRDARRYDGGFTLY
nr:hypothetical protein [uncultured Oscillibacter sp.]